MLILIKDQIINQRLNILIASIYAIYNTVYVGWSVSQQMLMSYKKVFLFVK